MKIGIIGATGFLGMNINRYLTQFTDYEIHLQSREKNNLPGNWHFFKLEPSTDQQRATRAFIDQVDALIYLPHEGGPNIPLTWDSTQSTHSNMNAIFSLLHAVQNTPKMKPLKIIYASSGGAVYGISNKKIAWQESDIASPVSLYGASKLAIEQQFEIASLLGICTTMSLRIANPFGNHFPHHRKQGLIDVAFSCLKQDTTLNLHVPIHQVRDFISIDDVCEAFHQTLQHEFKSEVINIASGKGTQIGLVLDLIQEFGKKKLKINIQPPIPQLIQIDWSVLNIEKADRFLNWRPTQTLEDTIKAMFRAAI